MNDEMNCAMCDNIMLDYQSNNPHPFVLDGRVCIDCNGFVTSTRLIAKTIEDVKLIQSVLLTAFMFRKTQELARKALIELKGSEEE